MSSMDENPHTRQTICELHRRMYRELIRRNPNDPLIPLLKDAFDIGKKMSNKLRKNKHDYDDGWYELHKYDGGELSEEERSPA